MQFDAVKQVRTIVIPKETSCYRIVTDNPDNWYLIANRPIAQGEFFTASADTTFHVEDVRGVEFVNVLLEETQEIRKVYTIISAVPSDASCVPNVLEIPWCFMNHSCKPNTLDLWNTMLPAKLKFVKTKATRDIAKGEELTYDYALEQYNYESQFECRCGVESCRGMIRGFN